MEAKDTVKKVNLDDYDNKRCHWKVDEMLAEQAEITWDRAIREVVEYMEKHNGSTWGNLFVHIDGFDWQAQKKKWGIE